MTEPGPARLNVLVYDDDGNNAAGIADRLRAFPDLDVRVLDDSPQALEDLEQRRRGVRLDHNAGTAEGGNAFDGVDVLVVDYDLTLELDAAAGPAETGERVAYLARCYSTCRTVVALNQFADRPTFDLTLLGHPSSYADLNIDGSQIDNPGLWGRPHDGFLPWAWPDLSRAPTAHAERVFAAADALGRPVLQVLGLADPPIANALARRQLAWLGAGDKPAGDVTVADCAAGGRLGLKPSDRPWGEHGLASVAAARLHKWLERVVLPGQDVLVDAPHAAARYRSLARWPESGGLPGLDETVAADHQHQAPVWTARPTYLWPGLSEDDRVREVRDPFAPVHEGPSFAEDSSVFRDPDVTRPFTADVEPYSRRHVTRQARTDAERGAAPYAGAHGLGRVSYQPAVNLAR